MEGRLLHGLLERMAPLVRRDCNYSNLDRLKKEAVWDEDGGVWRLPDVVVEKTTLPSGEGGRVLVRSRLQPVGLDVAVFASRSGASEAFSSRRFGC